MNTLSLPGIATILAFKSSASKVFFMILDGIDYISEAIEKVAKKVKAEIINIEQFSQPV